MVQLNITYHYLFWLFFFVLIKSSHAQMDVVFHHRNNAAIDIQNKEFSKILLSKKVYVKNMGDTVRANVLRIWEREMVLLFEKNYTRLPSIILYNNEEYYSNQLKRVRINASLRRYFPYYYVEGFLVKDSLEATIFSYLKRKHKTILLDISGSDVLSAEEKSFLHSYVLMYLYYAYDECSEEVRDELLNKAKTHVFRFPVSIYNDFIKKLILDHEYSSQTNFESALAPIRFYFPISGDLGYDIQSKLNLFHYNLGLSYKNAFIKASGGFSFLKFKDYHVPEDNLGILGLSGQLVVGHDFHFGEYNDWTISPFIGINYMIFRERILELSSNNILYDDLSSIFGINIDLNYSFDADCDENVVNSRKFHRLQLGLSPMALSTSGHESGVALMFQYSVGFQRNIGKKGYMFD